MDVEAPMPEGRAEKPPRFPTALEFKLRLLRLKKSENNEALPPVPENPTASEVAKYARFDWEHIKYGHGQSSPEGLTGYLHKMAKLMMTREGYTGKNSAGQPIDGNSLYVPDEYDERHQWIGVDHDWRIGVDGNHRALALRLLGPKFVEKSGMNDWVKIWKLNRRKM